MTSLLRFRKAGICWLIIEHHMRVSRWLARLAMAGSQSGAILLFGLWRIDARQGGALLIVRFNCSNGQLPARSDVQQNGCQRPILVEGSRSRNLDYCGENLELFRRWLIEYQRMKADII